MNKLCLLVLMALPLIAAAQENTAQDTLETTNENDTRTIERAAPTAPAVAGEVSINLRTTVTGNQEQPRVMYILPWQSPLSPELEMDMLGSEADAVFGHLERDELQRNLEAAGELDAVQ